MEVAIQGKLNISEQLGGTLNNVINKGTTSFADVLGSISSSIKDAIPSSKPQASNIGTSKKISDKQASQDQARNTENQETATATNVASKKAEQPKAKSETKSNDQVANEKPKRENTEQNEEETMECNIVSTPMLRAVDPNPTSSNAQEIPLEQKAIELSNLDEQNLEIDSEVEVLDPTLAMPTVNQHIDPRTMQDVTTNTSTLDHDLKIAPKDPSIYANPTVNMISDPSVEISQDENSSADLMDYLNLARGMDPAVTKNSDQILTSSNAHSLNLVRETSNQESNASKDLDLSALKLGEIPIDQDLQAQENSTILQEYSQLFETKTGNDLTKNTTVATQISSAASFLLKGGMNVLRSDLSAPVDRNVEQGSISESLVATGEIESEDPTIAQASFLDTLKADRRATANDQEQIITNTTNSVDPKNAININNAFGGFELNAIKPNRVDPNLSNGIEIDQKISNVSTNHVTSVVTDKGLNVEQKLADLPELQKTVHLSRNYEENAKQVAEKLNIMLAKNLKEAELNLDPVGLGKMKISLQLSEDGVARVNMIVQQSETKDLVYESLHKLREFMEQKGFSLGDSSVEQQEQWAQNSQNGETSQTNDQTFDKIADNEQVDSINVSVSLSDQAVDYFA